MDDEIDPDSENVFCTDEAEIDRRSIWNSYSVICEHIERRGYDDFVDRIESYQQFLEKFKDESDIRSKMELVAKKTINLKNAIAKIPKGIHLEDDDVPEDFRIQYKFVFEAYQKNNSHANRLRLANSLRTYIPLKKIIVFWESSKINTELIGKYIKILEKKRVSNCIIISSSGFTKNKNVKKVITNLKQISSTGEYIFNIYLNLFSENSLQYNIFKSIHMPLDYQILSREEREQLLKCYSCKPSQLPKIKQENIIVCLLGLEKGDILKIKEKSQVTGLLRVTYRIVQ